MKSKKRFLRFLIGQAPLLLAVIGLSAILGVLLDRMDRNRLDARITADIAALTGSMELSIQTDLYGKVLALNGLVAAAEMLPEMTSSEFERLALRVLDGAPAIMKVTVAPDLVIQHVFPSALNAVLIGQDYRDLYEKQHSIDAAVASYRAVLSQPYVSLEGRRVVALRERIDTLDGLFWGLASITIDLDDLFRPLLQEVQQAGDYRVAIKMDGIGVFGDKDVFADAPRLHDIQIQTFGFTAAIVPVGGWPTLPVLTLTRVGVVLAMVLLLWSGHVNYHRNYQRRVVVERLEKGIDALSSGFVIFDDEDRLVHWNETYEKLFNKGSVLTKGMSCADLMRMDMQHGIYRVPSGQEDVWFSQVMHGHLGAQDAAEVELADGRWIKMLSRRTQEGDLVGVRFDITDLKHAQLTAEHMSRAKSEFISVLSHELRTPLTTILGFGRLLKSRPVMTGNAAQDAFAQDAVERIVLSGEHLLKLVNEMLDYVNLTSAVPGQSGTAFDLSEVIAKSAAAMRPLAEAKGVTLEAEPCSITVSADSARVGQIMENLLSNAVKFTAAGGSVRITTTTVPQCAKITVSDTGDGIPEAELDAIFEEFSQVHPSGTRPQGGTGLGLAITKRLVSLQGGDITVQSTPGLGSAFTFSLPLDQQSAA
ncbi:MAG: ATP-binding protein [Rhodobacterales bacterium]